MELQDFTGIVIGLSTFLIIGMFHPLVIKAEYYLGKESWWLFMLAGLGFAAASVLIGNTNLILSIIAGVISFSSFWSILELFQQEKRVEKGWFPANPKRRKKK